MIEIINKEEYIPRIKTTIKEPNTQTEDDKDFNWKSVEKAMERNKGHRIKWDDILKCSLTEWVVRLRKEGLSAEEVIDLTCNEYPFLRRKEFIDKIKIGVNARFAEMNTYERVMEEEGGEKKW